MTYRWRGEFGRVEGECPGILAVVESEPLQFRRRPGRPLLTQVDDQPETAQHRAQYSQTAAQPSLYLHIQKFIGAVHKPSAANIYMWTSPISSRTSMMHIVHFYKFNEIVNENKDEGQFGPCPLPSEIMLSYSYPAGFNRHFFWSHHCV